MTNYMPNGANQTLINSELYFLEDGKSRPRSLGYVDSATYAPEVEESEKKGVGPGGAIITTATTTTSTGATLSLVLSETTAINMAMALQGDLVTLTQEEGTALEINETDVNGGEIIDLAALNVTNVSLTDGTDPLVEGVDYVLNAEAGVITLVNEFASVVGTYDKPAILADAGRQAIEVLKKAQGTKGVFTLVGINERGTRYKYSGLRAELRPQGDLAFISTEGDFQSVELTGKVVANPLLPATPYGRVEVLN